MSWRDALINPFDFTAACTRAVERPVVISADDGTGNAPEPCPLACRFELDPDAFLAEIEPAPLFLQDCEDAIRELLRSSGEAA